MLSKNIHSISYYFCREAISAGMIRIAKEDTISNLEEIFTKIMSRHRRDKLLDHFMY